MARGRATRGRSRREVGDVVTTYEANPRRCRLARVGQARAVSLRRVRVSATRCRAIVSLTRVLVPSGSPWEACTLAGLHPETPIAGPPAASSPQTYRGNQLDNQARSGFTASHYGSVETRVYQRREGLHVFTGAIHLEQSIDLDVSTFVATVISVLIVD